MGYWERYALRWEDPSTSALRWPDEIRSKEFSKEKSYDDHPSERWGLYPHRVARCHCDHSHLGCDPVPRLRPGAGQGPLRLVPLQPQADGHRLDDVHPGL